ncbi:hypothetical protein T492DRAFT_876945 [Pavlovales sp. CCMP2436]|nr:hypothetical protein T492DRAFT_876945 [Pavlovales sp. CCMP2436]
MAGAAAEVDELRLLIDDATRGDSDAQCRLGERYERGDGVVQNQAEALRLYTLAAKQGNAEAQHELGQCYMTGNGTAHDEGVVEDEEEAMKLYTQAAEQGLAQAQVYLGDCYQYGRGCAKNEKEADEKEAMRLYTQAAEQGFAMVQNTLGDCYRTGAGVEQDLETAVRLYTQAAEQGLAQAQVELGICYEKGEGCVQDNARAARLFRQVADQGYAPAQSSVGKCCMQGFGMAHDIADAARYFLLAADQGDATAQCLLGFLCEHGKGTKRDLGETMRMYRASAAQRDVRALARLGVCLGKGRGVPQSEMEAAASYAAASELGGFDALFGYGKAKLDALAVSDLALAARLGHAGAVEELASISSRREVMSACCLGCGATRELRLCSRCRVAAFCDGDCVRRMWPAHKPARVLIMLKLSQPKAAARAKGATLKNNTNIMNKETLVKGLSSDIVELPAAGELLSFRLRTPAEFIDYIRHHPGVLLVNTAVIPAADCADDDIVNAHLETIYANSAEICEQALSDKIDDLILDLIKCQISAHDPNEITSGYLSASQILNSIELVNANKSVEAHVGDLYKFATAVVSMHDSASSTSGAQILSAVHHLKQLYEPHLDLDPAAFEQIIQLSLITPISSLLNAFSRPDARARFTDEVSKFIAPQRAARAPPAHPPSRNTLLSCEHCKKTGHTASDCWQLNGFPPKNEQPITVNSGQAAAKRAANYAI